MTTKRIHEHIFQDCSIKNADIGKLQVGYVYPHGAKFAPVCPIHIYEALANRNIYLRNVLLLAHDVVNPEYRERYEKLFNVGYYRHANIIMDNSLIETGNAVDLEMLVDACEIVNANVTVLPDILNGGLKSATLTIQSWDAFKTKFGTSVQLMAVIQGKSMMDWIQSAETIKHHIRPDWISIPRCMEGIDGYHRYEMVNYACTLFPNTPIHLLGFSDYPWEDIRAAQHTAVKSIDSAAPLRFKHGYILGGDAGPRDDWWDTVQFNPELVKIINNMNEMIG